jgi:AcrR family transcriptional regulator
MKTSNLNNTLATKKASARRAAVRFGRPPKELVGEVEERILDAARKVFIERGFEGASIDEIAAAARAGKPTIYARFPGKEALFTAVVMQSVTANITSMQATTPAGGTIDRRLENLGAAILQRILVGNVVGLMRVAIAEARRFPSLANSVYGMAREHAVEGLARLLAETANSSELGTLPAFTPERLAATTRFFQDLVLFPLILRALFGEKLRELSAEIEPHVTHSVTFFLAACRHGGVS